MEANGKIDIPLHCPQWTNGNNRGHISLFNISVRSTNKGSCMDVVRHHLCLVRGQRQSTLIDRQRRTKTDREMGLSFICWWLLDTGTQMNVLMHQTATLGEEVKERKKRTLKHYFDGS